MIFIFYSLFFRKECKAYSLSQQDQHDEQYQMFYQYFLLSILLRIFYHMITFIKVKDQHFILCLNNNDLISH